VLFLRPGSAAPTVTVSAANVQIDPSGTDSYSIQGSISGITADGAQSIVFSVAQFGMAIPLTAFVQQPGSNVYQYTDAKGMALYWVSSLTLDLDQNRFSASVSGIVLSGLPNPFPLYVGTDVTRACGIVRLQSVAAGQYQLNPADPPTQACAMPLPPVADPPVVPAGGTGKVTITLAATGLDKNSAMLYTADDNAQPMSAPLCTFHDNGNGTSSCTVSFSQANAGPVPLLVQATVGGRQVLAPGFFIQAVNPISDADMQQLSDVQGIVLNVAAQAYSQYGDTAYARVQVLSALRQYFQAAAGLTGQPVSLSPDGWELGAICTSGIPVVYIMGEQDPDDSGDSTPQQARLRGRTSAAANHAGFSTGPLRPNVTAAPSQCGDFARQIVGNNKVLIWDPGSAFVKGEPTPLTANLLRNSSCPHFTFNELYDIAATAESLSLISQYSTVLLTTHGGVDPGGRFYIVSGTPSPFSANYFAGPGSSIELGTVCFRITNGNQGCYVSVYPNYRAFQQAASNTIIFGLFCNGFYGLYPGSQVPQPYIPSQILPPQWPQVLARGANNAFFGFDLYVTVRQGRAAGLAVFNTLLHEYGSAADAANAGVSAVPTMRLYPTDSNLAYVGNPALKLAALAPPVPSGSNGLAAYLDGTASCGQNGSPYMQVKWTNPAKAGHLDSVTSMVSGKQDNFMNLASQSVFLPQVGGYPALVNDEAEAKFTPDASLAANSDQIMADFYPDTSNQRPAGRACLTVPGNGLFVTDQLAAIWDALTPSQIPDITQFPIPLKITRPIPYPLHDPGGYAAKGAKASVTVTPSGQNKWTVTVTAGGSNPNYPNNRLPPGSGPYMGRGVIGLQAINPGPAGHAFVRVTATINNQDVCQTVPPFPTPACTSADGVLIIGDSNGKLLLSGSLYHGDKNAVGASPPTFSADSSCSGLQPSAQCPHPQGVGIRVQLTEARHVLGHAQYRVRESITFGPGLGGSSRFRIGKISRGDQRQRSAGLIRVRLLGKPEDLRRAVPVNARGIYQGNGRRLRIRAQHAGPHDERRVGMARPLRRRQTWPCPGRLGLSNGGHSHGSMASGRGPRAGVPFHFAGRRSQPLPAVLFRRTHVFHAAGRASAACGQPFCSSPGTGRAAAAVGGPRTGQLRHPVLLRTEPGSCALPAVSARSTYR
jgi:hypothetical protein